MTSSWLSIVIKVIMLMKIALVALFSPFDHPKMPCMNIGQTIFNTCSIICIKMLDGFTANTTWITKIHMAITDVSCWIKPWITPLSYTHSLCCWQMTVRISAVTLQTRENIIVFQIIWMDIIIDYRKNQSQKMLRSIWYPMSKNDISLFLFFHGHTKE